MAAFLGNVFMYVGLFGPLVALIGLVIYEGYLTFTGNSNALFAWGGGKGTTGSGTVVTLPEAGGSVTKTASGN